MNKNCSVESVSCARCQPLFLCASLCLWCPQWVHVFTLKCEWGRASVHTHTHTLKKTSWEKLHRHRFLYHQILRKRKFDDSLTGKFPVNQFIIYSIKIAAFALFEWEQRVHVFVCSRFWVLQLSQGPHQDQKILFTQSRPLRWCGTGQLSPQSWNWTWWSSFPSYSGLFYARLHLITCKSLTCLVVWWI